MKNVIKAILLISSIFFVLACVKVTESEPITVKGKIIYRFHKDSKTEFKYHYGYNFMNGKYQYHMGNVTESEENVVKFIFLGDTLSRDSETLFNKQTDSLEIQYVKVYYTKKNKEPKFDHNNIIDIK